MSFYSLAPTVALCILCREGNLQKIEWKGNSAARRPAQPPGTFLDLERECVTGGTAQGTPRGIL